MTEKDPSMRQPKQTFPSDEEFKDYQIIFLLNEVKHLRSINSESFIRKHFKQFYWTVTRLLGLGRLHGSREILNKNPARPTLETPESTLVGSCRVFIDVTVTHRNKLRTGIQRVVREVARNSILAGSAMPVIMENGRFIPYYKNDKCEIIDIVAGDKVLFLDSGWPLIDDYREIMQYVKEQGGQIICCIYDLIPLLYEGLFDINSQKVFLDWLNLCLQGDRMVTISRSVAEDIINYVNKNRLSSNKDLMLGWFYLGANLSAGSSDKLSSFVEGICSKSRFLLSVGTIEPRKNHKIALDAFDLLWAGGIDVKYVIVGVRGWLADAIVYRITNHPQFGRNLIWLEHAGDADLNSLYSHAIAVIQPSIAEGFGLPLVEAAAHGTPVLASNIRIFNEISGPAIRYFDPMSAQELADYVIEMLSKQPIGLSITPLGWDRATDELIKMIHDERYQFSLADE